MRSDPHRAAWTEFVEGANAEPAKPSKYRNQRTEFNGKWYASKREAEMAAKLHILASRGLIRDLQEQVGFTLVEGNGKIRPIRYVADFTYRDDADRLHILDAKGYSKNRVWRLKKKLMMLMLGLEIEEV